MRGTVYLKNDSKTKEKNERLKEVPDTEEIMEAIKETRLEWMRCESGL